MIYVLEVVFERSQALFENLGSWNEYFLNSICEDPEDLDHCTVYFGFEVHKVQKVDSS